MNHRESYMINSLNHIKISWFYIKWRLRKQIEKGLGVLLHEIVMTMYFSVMYYSSHGARWV
ncbi:hypothetical protein CCP4SC76_3690006 [Gammaproteobacteria bacterium]